MPMSPRLLRPRASGVAFNPLSVSNMALWLDAKDASSITLNGSNISQWRDKSGNGRHLSQSTAARQPPFSATAMNGNAAATFASSSSHFLEGTAWALTTQTVFWVVRFNSTPQSEPLTICTSATSPAALNQLVLGLGGGAYKTFTIAAGLTTNGTAVGDTTSYATGSPRLIAWTYNGSGSGSTGNFSIRRSRANITVQTSGFIGPPSTGYRLGLGMSNQYGLDGNVSSLIVYSRVLSATEIAAVEDYLFARYSL